MGSSNLGRAQEAITAGGISEGLRGFGSLNPFGRTRRGFSPEEPDIDLAEFNRRLAEINPQFFEADFGAERFGGIADVLEQRGRGIAPRDPAFERFQEAQFNVFEQGAEEQRRNVASELSRRGLGGSSTAINALGRVDERLAGQRAALGGQLGIQELQRQDQALLQAAGVLGQAGAARDLELSARAAGLENLLAGPALQVSRQAAIAAGRLPQERQPGILGGVLGGLL